MRHTLPLLIALAFAAPGLARADEHIPTKPRSVPLLVVGVTGASVGATALVGGGVFMVIGALFPGPQPQIVCVSGACPQYDPGPRPAIVIGATLMASGGLLLAGSIPLIVLGAKQVPARARDVEVGAGPNGTPGMTVRIAF